MAKFSAAFLFSFLLSSVFCYAQPITGIWRGKVVKGAPPFSTTYKLELKLIRQGDSLTGTSYYYANANNFYRYSIKGYQDAVDGSFHWWDDVLIERKGGGGSVLNTLNGQPLMAAADYNCPGAGLFKLYGGCKAGSGPKMELQLTKEESPLFADGWDEVIDNWLTGGAHPDLIASVQQEQINPKKLPPAMEVSPAPPPAAVVNAKPKPSKPSFSKPKSPVASVPTPAPTAPVEVNAQPVPEHPKIALPPPVLTTQQKFETRQKVVQTTLPVTGDSIELQFFDNAEIDGDSIALYLNGRMIFEHIKLSAEPFIIKLSTAELTTNSELSMVAENLGAIPPNTSFMLAYVNGQRYTARLESTENTTAVIRFSKE